MQKSLCVVFWVMLWTTWQSKKRAKIVGSRGWNLIIYSQKDYWYNNVCFGLSSTFNTLISKWEFFFFWPLSFPVGKESRGSKAWSFWWSYYQLQACIVCFWVINHPFTHRPQTFWYISLLLCFISFLKSRLISLLQQIPLFPSPWIRAD